MISGHNVDRRRRKNYLLKIRLRRDITIAHPDAAVFARRSQSKYPRYPRDASVPFARRCNPKVQMLPLSYNPSQMLPPNPLRKADG